MTSRNRIQPKASPLKMVATRLTVQVASLRGSMSGSLRVAVWMLLGAVGLLLTLVLFNLGNLLLTRSTTNRLHEYSLRQALGASRRQIFRQTFIEQNIVVLTASTLSLVLAAWGLQLIRVVAADARTGANLQERARTPKNVNARNFGRVFSLELDGDIYAQPLYLPNLKIPGKGLT